MKKIILLLLSLIFAAALLILSGSVELKSTLLGEVKTKENILYIGVNEALTGDDAEGAARELLGFRYANSVCPTVDLNGETYSITLVEADNLSTKEGAAAAAKTLVDAGVFAVLGPYDSELCAASLPVTQASGIALISVSASSERISGTGADFFRLCFLDGFQSSVMANLARSMEFEKAAIITQTADDYSKAAGKLFEKEFKHLGGETVNFSFQSGQENFKALTQEILSSGADVVFMLSGPSEAKYFISQSRKLGLRAAIFGPENWDSGLLLADASVYSGSVYFASEFDGSSGSNPVFAEFAQRFSAWVDNDSQRLALNGGSNYASSATALGYDAYMLAVNALKSAGSADPVAVSAAIRAGGYTGVMGKIAFDEAGESGVKQAFIKTIDTTALQFEVTQTISAGG